MTLGDIIKKYRKEHSLSMDAFSRKSGMSKAYISLLEKNKHPKTGKPIAPSIQSIKQAADGMGMDFNVLFNLLDGDVTLSSSNLPFSLLGTKKILRTDESDLLNNYNLLNATGKTKAREYVSDLTENRKYFDTKPEPLLYAAHERTDIEVTDEMRQHDDAIMDDEDF